MQRWQASDFMKYLKECCRHVWFARSWGKFPLWAVTFAVHCFAGISGLEMRFAFFQATSRVHHVPAAMALLAELARQIPSSAGQYCHPATLSK